MLLIVQIWDAQNQEVTRRVGATSRRIASKIAEVLQTERPQRLCRKQTRRRHSRREDKRHRFKQDTKRTDTPSGGRWPMSALCQKRTLCSAAKSVAFNTPGAGKRHELFFAPFASEKRTGGPGLNWRTWNRAVGAENTTCSLLRPQSLTAARTFVGD